SSSMPPPPPHSSLFPLHDALPIWFVYRARQPKLDRDVALKILPQAFAGDPAFAERFAREGRLLARLNHPIIVSVSDFGQANGFLDRKSTRLNSSHVSISYAVFCLK